MPNVAPPSSGLGSNSNYFLSAGGEPIIDLEVTIDITEELTSNIGYGFQLNAYSPAGKYSAWQQYVLQFDTPLGYTGGQPGTLNGVIEPWPDTTAGVRNDTTSGDLINRSYNLLTLQNPVMLAGYKLTMTLGTDGSSNVRYITLTATDNNGNLSQTNPSTIDIVGLPLDNTSGNLATTNDIAPIIAFQLNLVGPFNSLQSYMPTGGGTIRYSSSTALSAAPGLPQSADSNWYTEETTNSFYGELATGSSTSITQSFTIKDPGAYGPGDVPDYFGTPQTMALAAAQQVALDQTDVFAINRAGQPVVFYVGGGGHWSSLLPLGPTGLARRDAALAASPQFGAPNQTDLFVVGQNGQLNVFWFDGSGAWNGPQTIGAAGYAPSGANMAVSRQFGLDQTDVFLVDHKGQLSVFWVDGTGAWSGPQTISAASYAPSGCILAASQQFGVTNQTDVFLVDTKGQLSVFWVDGGGGWNGPQTIGAAGYAPSGAGVAASQQFGLDQTDVFVVDNKGQLSVFWVDGGGGWNGPQTIGAAGIAPPGASLATSRQFGVTNQTDVFLIDNNGQLNVFWVDGGGSWNGPEKLGPSGIATPGACVAASQQFGVTNQTDVFLIDNSHGPSGPGWPVVFWVAAGGTWNGPSSLATQV
jgi:hypothetical protein